MSNPKSTVNKEFAFIHDGIALGLIFGVVALCAVCLGLRLLDPPPNTEYLNGIVMTAYHRYGCIVQTEDGRLITVDQQRVDNGSHVTVQTGRSNFIISVQK